MRKGMIAAVLALLLCLLLCGCGENTPEQPSAASSGAASSVNASSEGGESKTPLTDFVRVPRAVTVFYPDGGEWDITYSYDPASGVLHREEGALAMDAILTTDFALDETGAGLAMYTGYKGEGGFTYEDGKLLSCAWGNATGRIQRNSSGKRAGLIAGMDWTADGESRHIGCEVKDGLVLSLDLEFAGERIFYDYFNTGERIDGYNLRMEKYGDLVWSAEVKLTYTDGLLTQKEAVVTHESDPQEDQVSAIPPVGKTVWHYTYDGTIPDIFAAAEPSFAFLSPEWRFLLQPCEEGWIL